MTTKERPSEYFAKKVFNRPKMYKYLPLHVYEKLTGLTVDHFVQIGMAAVPGLVDAVGGVELCYDNDANDPS